ncbi:MAG: Na+/H+ antiporter NhaC family protein, partial [Lentisphaeria bacterium]|nr:Na+/H+ antiporter NhaC family protein [Lentisphaeria bacterium]
AKLAYILDATAAPVCMIAPISSWAAAVSQYSKGSNCSGLEMFIRAIPYNFYSLLTLIFIVALTLLKLDYGPMARHERLAQERGILFPRRRHAYIADETVQPEHPRTRIADMLIPVILLIVCCVFALVYNGGIFDGRSFADAFSRTDAGVALPWGALAALIPIFVYLVLRRVISVKSAMECIPHGFIAMVPAILILTLATTLKNMTGLLEAKEFIARQMSTAAPGLAQFLPAVIFFVAAVLAFSTGTSWGTFGILIPIVVEIFPGGSPLLFIGMSACLAGAVCGDHCSPISDTTIMSSAGARCEHIDHVSTQLPYAGTVAFFSFVGFLLAGMIRNWFIVFPFTAFLMLALLVFIKHYTHPSVPQE